MGFSMKRNKNEDNSSKAPVMPVANAQREIPIRPMPNYNGMLPKLNMGYGGKIFGSHVATGGIHGDRKY